VVERDEVAVMFKRVSDEQAAISCGWAEMELTVGSLRGRKFYGVFDKTKHEYRVCVQVREGDDAAAFGLEMGTLPGGRYAQVRLHGDPPAVYELIAPTFERAWRLGRTATSVVRESRSTDATTSSTCFCRSVSGIAEIAAHD
jgi:hypothetical protein